MRFRKSSRRTPPATRLLPLDAYPAAIDEAARNRLDRFLREKLPTVPVEPDAYLDKEAEPWTLNTDGSWTDKNGMTRSILYAPILSLFGPFTRVGAPAHG